MEFKKTLHIGQGYSFRCKRGSALSIRACGEGANVAALFFNARQPSERYNMPDTLKGQHLYKLTTGCCLHSDMGRLLASITHDTYGWHDPLCGLSSAGDIASVFGNKTFQEAHNACYRNGHDVMMRELLKQGLSEKDLIPCVNFFSTVIVDETGQMRYEPAACSGAKVVLRAEMDLIVCLSNTPHPLTTATTYPQAEVELELQQGFFAHAEDECIRSRPENERAWQNTCEYAWLCGMEGV